MARRIFELEASCRAHNLKVLREQFSNEPEDGDAFIDTLNGMDDFDELVDALIAECDRDEMSAALCEAEADLYKEKITEVLHRRDRLVARSKKRKIRILAAFDSIGITGIERPTYTLSRAEGARRVIVTNMDLLPDKYLRRKPAPPPEPDLVAIGKALKSDDPQERMALSEAAVLANGNPRLDVRRK